MGRPVKKIDPKLVQDLAAIGCKTTEIASIVGVSVDTLDRRFAEEMEKGRSNLRATLRRWQISAAQKGNVAMLIWLGKQLLGQTEKIEQATEFVVKPLSPQQVQTILTGDPFLHEPDRRVVDVRSEAAPSDPKPTGGDQES